MTQLVFVHHTERPVGHHSLTEINKPNPLFDASQYNEKGLLKSGMISISEFWTDTLTSLKAFSHSSVQLKAVFFFNKSHNVATLIEKFLIKCRRKPAKPKNVRSSLTDSGRWKFANSCTLSWFNWSPSELTVSPKNVNFIWTNLVFTFVDV